MKRALVIGASGYLGRRMIEILGPDRAVGTGHGRASDGLVPFDAVNDRLSDLLESLGGDITHVFVFFGLVNPDRCARDPDGTAVTNVAAVKRVIEDAQAAGLTPVYSSTDYVFDGSRGLREESEAQCPNTEYGRQKAAVERWLQERSGSWMIARLSKLVGAETDTHSVLGQWVNDIRAGKVMRSATDQVFSPAFVDDIARALVDLASRKIGGIIHVAGAPISRYDLNRLLAEEINALDPSRNVRVEPCRLAEVPFAEQRPLDTSLSTRRLESVLDWRLTPIGDYVRAVAAQHFAPAVEGVA